MTIDDDDDGDDDYDDMTMTMTIDNDNDSMTMTMTVDCWRGYARRFCSDDVRLCKRYRRLTNDDDYDSVRRRVTMMFDDREGWMTTWIIG